jgi:radical SAM superfamily enzyme YgiQ (UPF0313 family)
LISTYDLGRQPFGLASPAAWLRRAGAEVICLDLSVSSLDEAAVREADVIAFYLPMHTATRLAVQLLPRIKALNPEARLWFYGLYAAMNAATLGRLGAEAIFGGEFEAAMASSIRRRGVELRGLRSDALQPETWVALDRQDFITPERDGLPTLSMYAHLHDVDGSRRVVGYTEASRGCKHRCRHCPVVPVYGGRFRVVAREVVLEDVRRQVAAGAEHITFGDPDFFNGIGHALPLVRSLHREHPMLGYDVTIKIEHLLHHREHLPTLRETGCRFVTSAVESIDDRVLALLEKGHTRGDFLEAVRCCRDANLPLSPTFVAFTPWISPAGYHELLELIADLGLVQHVAPVQLAMRLLVPAGSRLLELAELRDRLGDFDERLLVHPWLHPDPEVDRLCERVQRAVREGCAATWVARSDADSLRERALVLLSGAARGAGCSRLIPKSRRRP